VPHIKWTQVLESRKLANDTKQRTLVVLAIATEIGI